jgi:hypothetical protein
MRFAESIQRPRRCDRMTAIIEKQRNREQLPYRMHSVLGTVEVDHTIDTRKRGTPTSTTMRIEFLLGEDIPTGL